MRYLLITLFLFGCSDKQYISSSSLFEEAQFSKLNSIESLELINLLNKFHEASVFEEIEIAKFGSFTVMHSGKDDFLYILKDNSVLAKHTSKEKTFLYNSKLAPLPATYFVEYDKTNHSIAYINELHEYFDYGMDGLDVIYKIRPQDMFTDSLAVVSDPVSTFYKGKQCILYPTEIPTTVSCCEVDEGVFSGLFFSRTKGWVKLNDKARLKQSELDSFCKAYNN